MGGIWSEMFAKLKLARSIAFSPRWFHSSVRLSEGGCV
jgi:hypothetical protein